MARLKQRLERLEEITKYCCIVTKLGYQLCCIKEVIPAR